MYYPCSENKGADQLRVYRGADLRLCFIYAVCWFSHEVAQMQYKRAVAKLWEGFEIDD